MAKCFVMQVFDGAQYDTRYEETFAPAITAGGAVPIRADRISGTRPIIEKIEEAIRDCDIGFADISENNPNVFLELGYALAIGKPIVLVCDKAKRDGKLPFDIQHRPTIMYNANTQGGFLKLSTQLSDAIGAALTEASTAQQILLPSGAASSSDLDALKRQILLVILEAEMGDAEGLSAYRLKDQIGKLGFSDHLISLAALSLRGEGLLTSSTRMSFNDEEYLTFNLTEAAQGILLRQYAEIYREEAARVARKPSGTTRGGFGSTAKGFADDLDDDVPF